MGRGRSKGVHRCDLTKDCFPEETGGLLMRSPPALPGNQSPGEEWGIPCEGGESQGAAAGEGVVIATGIGVSKENHCSASWQVVVGGQPWSPLFSLLFLPVSEKLLLSFVGVTEVLWLDRKVDLIFSLLLTDV